MTLPTGARFLYTQCMMEWSLAASPPYGSNVVYWMYNQEHVVVYIGCTRYLAQRIKAHRNRGKFAISRVTFQVYPTLRMAQDAERAAVLREQPTHNRLWNREYTEIRNALKILGKQLHCAE